MSIKVSTHGTVLSWHEWTLKESLKYIETSPSQSPSFSMSNLLPVTMVFEQMLRWMMIDRLCRIPGVHNIVRWRALLRKLHKENYIIEPWACKIYAMIYDDEDSQSKSRSLLLHQLNCTLWNHKKVNCPR